MHFKKGHYYIYKNIYGFYLFRYIGTRLWKNSSIRYHYCYLIKHSNFPDSSGKIDTFSNHSIIVKYSKEISEKEAFIWAL